MCATDLKVDAVINAPVQPGLLASRESRLSRYGWMFSGACAGVTGRRLMTSATHTSLVGTTIGEAINPYRHTFVFGIFMHLYMNNLLTKK